VQPTRLVVRRSTARRQRRWVTRRSARRADTVAAERKRLHDRRTTAIVSSRSTRERRMAKVVFEDVNKVFPDGTHAIFDLNLEIEDGSS
jgi:hypothetical protein